MWMLSPSGWPTFADTADEQAVLTAAGYVPIDESQVQPAIDAYHAGSPPPGVPDFVDTTELPAAMAAVAADSSSAFAVQQRAAYGLRPAATIAYLGDSISALGAPTTSGVQTYHDTRGFTTWVNAFLGQRIAPVYAGVAGETTVQIASRAAAVISQRPTFLHLLAGTNDMIGLVSMASSQGAVTSILDDAAAAGVPVIVGTLPPYQASGGAAATTAQLQWIEQYNRWLKSLPGSRVGVCVIDYHGLLAGASGGWRNPAQFITTSDWTHPSAGGASIMGRALADLLTSFLPALDIMPTSNVDVPGSGTTPQQILTNPMMIGTGGAKPFGTAVADSWTVKADSGTLDASTGLAKVARSDGKPGEWQQIVNPVQQNLRIFQDLPSITAGSTISAAIEMQADSDWTFGQGLALHLIVFDANAGYATRLDLNGFYYDPNDGAAQPIDNRPISVVVRTPEGAMPSNATGATLAVDHFGTGTIRVGRCAVWQH